MLGISPLGITFLLISSAFTTYGIFEAESSRADSFTEMIVRVAMYLIAVALVLLGNFALFFAWTVPTQFATVTWSQKPALIEGRKEYGVTWLGTVSCLIQIGLYGLFQLVR